jgi:hypothetical protein
MVEAGSRAITSPLYDQPVLVVDPGMHTAPIRPLQWTQPGVSR